MSAGPEAPVAPPSAAEKVGTGPDTADKQRSDGAKHTGAEQPNTTQTFVAALEADRTEHPSDPEATLHDIAGRTVDTTDTPGEQSRDTVPQPGVRTDEQSRDTVPQPGVRTDEQSRDTVPQPGALTNESRDTVPQPGVPTNESRDTVPQPGVPTNESRDTVPQPGVPTNESRDTVPQPVDAVDDGSEAPAQEPSSADAYEQRRTEALNLNGISTEAQRRERNAQIDADRAAADPKGEKRYFNNLRTKASNVRTRYLDRKAARLDSRADDLKAKAEAVAAKADARRADTQTSESTTPTPDAAKAAPTAPEQARNENPPLTEATPGEVVAKAEQVAREAAEPSESGNENKADAELTPEQKVRAEKMQLIEGAQKLASMGIDINSEGGKRVLEMMLDNPQYAAEFNKATAGTEANIQLTTPEGAAAASDVMADALDDSIAQAEAAGDTQEVQRLSFLRGLLKAIATALLVVGGATAAYATGVGSGVVREGVTPPK